MRYFYLLFSLFISSNILCQDETSSIYQQLKMLPQAPPPNAAALGKYGDIPVSISTGIPYIQIPFFQYEDKLKKLRLSVSLTYHAGGNKVEDLASNVGLGWSLNTGGVISRTLKGLPDEGIGGYLMNPVLPFFNTTGFNSRLSEPYYTTPISEGICSYNSTYATEIKNIAEGNSDGEADIFTISMGDISGKFFFKKDGTIQLITQSNIKLKCNKTGTGPYGLGSFEILDENGIKYVFSNTESTQVTNSLQSLPIPAPYTSVWYISTIESADGKDIIQFNYNTIGDLLYESSFSKSYTSKYVDIGSGEYYWGTTLNDSYSIIQNSQPKRINSIIFPDGTNLNFVYGGIREDLYGDRPVSEVRLANQEFEKKFVLTYDYFNSDYCYNSDCTSGLPYSPNNYYKRLKLLSVQEVGQTMSLPPYTFEYNATKLPVPNSMYKDWWGYFKGAGDEQPDLAIVHNINPVPPSFFYGDNPPSPSLAKAWVLEKINFPTGGSTAFSYELNDGYYGSNYRTVGGLRINNIVDFDPITQKTSTTNYYYKNEDGSSSGEIHTVPTFTCYWTTLLNNSTWDPLQAPYKIYHLNESVVPSQTLSFLNGSPVLYKRVKVSRMDGTASNGYSVYEYYTNSKSMQDDIFPYVQMQDIEWTQGALKSEYVYNSSDKLVKSVINSYDFFTYAPLINDDLSRNVKVGLLYWDIEGTPANNMYGARSYYLCYGRAELKNTVERIYDLQGDSYMQNSTEYQYSPQYFVPTIKRTWDSKGVVKENKYYYAFDCTTTGLPLKQELLNANRIAEPIATELWETRNSENFLIDAATKEYQAISGMIKEIKTIQLETRTPLNQSLVGAFNPNSLKRISAFEVQVSILGYDGRGRIASFVNVGNEKYACFWGKSNQYPICMVNGVGAEKFAYASFEEDGNYGWENILSTSIINGKSITGIKYYEQTGFSLYKSGLTNTDEYLVTYWSKNGSYNVSNTTTGWPKVLRSINLDGQNWQCFEHKITSANSVTVSGSGAIDELRLYPINATISSVAVNSLKGVLSQCDVNNKTLFYEYDDFGRLTQVRDCDYNIIKKYCYNYAGQTISCN